MLLGGALAQVTFGKRLGKTAPLAGAIAALLPDLDVFVKSDTDPLLSLLVHRQFTHALIFIPLGGLLATVLYRFLCRGRPPFRESLFACLVAYTSHPLLDACTAYGTQLYWPFSSARVAWDILPIIDPIFSFLLLVGLCLFFWGKSIKYSYTAYTLWLGYLSLSFLQSFRAHEVQQNLLKARGHITDTYRVHPTLFNIVLWRSVYRMDGEIFADSIRVGLGEALLWEGGHVAAFEKSEIPNDGSRLAKDLERYFWFADGYLAKGENLISDREVATDRPFLADLRYSSIAHGLEPIWGIELPDEGGEHVRRRNLWGDRRRSLKALWQQITARYPGAKTLSEIALRHTE